MEYGVLSEETNRLVLPKNVGDLGISEFLPSNLKDDSYTNSTCEFSENDLVYTKTIRLSDLDYNNHGNNIAYIKMAQDCFTFEEFSTLNIKCLEMYYTNQCFEKDEISMYKKFIDNKYIIEGKTSNKSIFRAVFIV
jgi:acyl-ACP thioesterase